MSENPSPVPPEVLNALLPALSGLNRYPCPESLLLKRKLAELHGVEEESILIGNGTDEIIFASVLALLQRQEVGITNFGTFRGYEAAYRLMGAKVRLCRLDGYRIAGEEIVAQMEGARLAILCNPLNPTGTVLSKAELEAVVEAAARHNVVVLVDEAYAEFAELEGFDGSIDFVKNGWPVIVTRTFSKFYGLAGLRCGYAVASKEIIAQIARIKKTLPFSTNSLAQAAAIAALENKSLYRLMGLDLIANRNKYARQLAAGGIEGPRSFTNFLFLSMNQDATKLTERLREQLGIRVRDGSLFGFPGHVRISIGSTGVMDELASFLQKEYDS